MVRAVVEVNRLALGIEAGRDSLQLEIDASLGMLFDRPQHHPLPGQAFDVAGQRDAVVQRVWFQSDQGHRTSRVLSLEGLRAGGARDAVADDHEELRHKRSV